MERSKNFEQCLFIISLILLLVMMSACQVEAGCDPVASSVPVGGVTAEWFGVSSLIEEITFLEESLFVPFSSQFAVVFTQEEGLSPGLTASTISGDDEWNDEALAEFINENCPIEPIAIHINIPPPDRLAEFGFKPGSFLYLSVDNSSDSKEPIVLQMFRVESISADGLKLKLIQQPAGVFERIRRVLYQGNSA